MTQITRNIMAISRRNRQYRGEKMTPYGLKGIHTSYLCKICKNPGISQDQLAQELCLNKSSVARQAAFLEEEGYITRITDEADKRLLQLHPTEKALALIPQIRELLQNWDAFITADLAEEEVQILPQLPCKLEQRAVDWQEVL